LVDAVPEGSVWVLDGMVMFQQLRNQDIPEKLGDLAIFLLTRIIRVAKQHRSNEIHFVTDRYPEISIKNAERGKRAATGSERINIYSLFQSSGTSISQMARTKNAWSNFCLKNGLSVPLHCMKGLHYLWLMEKRVMLYAVMVMKLMWFLYQVYDATTKKQIQGCFYMPTMLQVIPQLLSSRAWTQIFLSLVLV
jgi:hypothetical protein